MEASVETAASELHAENQHQYDEGAYGAMKPPVDPQASDPITAAAITKQRTWVQSSSF